MLVAAMNPCNFSYLGDPIHPCTCTLLMIERYRNRLSGPLLDRIGLHIEVPRVPYKELADLVDAESSATVRALVEAARSIKNQRLAS
jgi:magnesium chelatase family protein